MEKGCKRLNGVQGRYGTRQGSCPGKAAVGQYTPGSGGVVDDLGALWWDGTLP